MRLVNHITSMERNLHVKVLRCFLKFVRNTESRYIEGRLHEKVWERKRDRTFAFVIEKIR